MVKSSVSATKMQRVRLRAMRQSPMQDMVANSVAKSTHGAERGYLLNPLLVVCDFVAGSALLAEPKYQATPRNKGSDKARKSVSARRRANTAAYEHTYFGGGGRRRPR